METHLNNDNVHVSLHLGVTKIVEPDRTFLCLPLNFLVFVDNFKAQIRFTERERYVSRSNLLVLGLHLYVDI